MHTPVLLKEVINLIQAEHLQELVDGTVGDGGYIREILRINESVKVLGIDLDQTSLDKLSMQLAQESLGQRCVLVQGNFRDIRKLCGDHNFHHVSGVILDLGFSSSQVDDQVRGLSFQSSGPLDMRFDLNQVKTAASVVNKYPLERLTEIFKNYGEEKLAGKIAFEIVRTRQKQEIKDTRDLFEVIKSALPKPVVYKAQDYARRIFQALRIEVNDELNNLKKVLPEILEILEPGGRMTIISFHSLEDRIVKEFFNQEAKGCICPPDFPQCVCGKNPRLKVVTKKPITASAEEIEINSRSKPAKLRVAEKVK
jgi:16S rRNA (cytosine1402-N4)-methyltransferase